MGGRSGDGHRAGGFVSGTGGNWSADPKGGLSESNYLVTTDTTPALKGFSFPDQSVDSYDPTAHRWLPVGLNQVRSDGLSYAYGEPNPNAASPGEGYVHIVSPVDGSEHRIAVGSPGPATVLAYQPEGIYFVLGPFFDFAPKNLRVLDPASGSVHAVAGGVTFNVIQHGIAWTDGWTIMPTKLIRYDVTTGDTRTWIDLGPVGPGSPGWISFVALDGNGHPIVDINRNSNPMSGTLYDFAHPDQPMALGAASFVRLYANATDSHGTWFTASDGIYLLEPNNVLVKVSNVSGGFVGGACT
jgi:hypothetical protein